MVAILQSPGTPTQADFHEAISNRSDAIMSISLHSGDRPVTILASIVKFGTDRKLREEALFWLGQSDLDEAFTVLDRLLSGAM